MKQTNSFSAKLSLISAFLMILALFPVHSAEIDNFDREVVINAREQPVQRFVMELFGRINVPVVVAPEITGVVNGDFVGTVEQVFNKVSKAFYVSHYYDGAMVHVYPANKSERVFIKMSSSASDKVLANVNQLSLPDAQNTITKTDMGLFVAGSEKFRSQVKEIASALTKTRKPKPQVVVEEEEGDSFRMFKLRYAWAHDVEMEIGGQQVTVPGVASTLRTLIEPGVATMAGESKRQTIGQTLPKLKGQGLQTTDKLAQEASGNSRAVFTRESDGSTRIVADSLNNAVLIRDKPERLEAYAKLIETLDIEPKMIEIEATIIDMDTDRLRDLGINWRAQFEDGEALLGNGTDSDLALQPGSQITPSGVGGILSLVLGDEQRFISRIRALESQGAARIVSKPHVMTLSNVEALLDTNSTFFVRVQGQEEVDLFNVSVGTTLRVTPHVFDGPTGPSIKLLVYIEDGTTSERQVDNIPVIETSTINTQALVNVGESLLIGGLVREFKGSSVTKVPVLGNIPVLGSLFRSNTKTSSRIERMFLISPRINLRPNGQKPTRLSEPYLAGTEGEILVTGPSRLQDTQRALAARDDYFGVVEDLPAGGADVSLIPKRTAPKVERLDTIEIVPTKTIAEESPWQEVRTTKQAEVVEDTPLAESDVKVLVPAPSTATASTKFRMPLSEDEQWQTIPVKPASIEKPLRRTKVAPAARLAAPAPRLDEADGWSEIK